MIGDWKITYDTYKGIKYAITSRRTTEKVDIFTSIIRDTRPGIEYRGPGHFCAYVECEQEDANHLEDFVHWGYTWYDFDKCYDGTIGATGFPDGTKAAEGMVVVGWDYHHYGDYHWDYEEIVEEVHTYIDELWKAKA